MSEARPVTIEVGYSEGKNGFTSEVKLNRRDKPASYFHKAGFKTAEEALAFGREYVKAILKKFGLENTEKFNERSEEIS